MNSQENLINSKYHLSVVKRMYENYKTYEDKRFIVGIINELAKSSSNMIKAYLIIEKDYSSNHLKNLKIFSNKVGPKYLNKKIIENILKSLEIQRAQKESPIEFSKEDKIIFLINGKYKFLTLKRLEEFINSVEIGILKLPKICRQI